MKDIKNVRSDREIVCVRNKAGNICELRFNILPHETVFIEMMK